MITTHSNQAVLVRDQEHSINNTQTSVEKRQNSDIDLTATDIQPTTAFDREVLRRFRVYLSQITIPLSLHECWADFQQIYPALPDGKARWSRILCAVIIVLRVRSQFASPIPLRTLLQIWNITRSDYFHVIEKMQQIPLLRDWITNRNSPHRPIFSNLSQIMHHIAQTLAIDQQLVDYALDMIQDKCFVNRSEIQAMAALLAAMELHPEITVVSANEICNIFPHVAKAHIIALKRRFLMGMTTKSQPMIPNTSRSTHPPRISHDVDVPNQSSQDVAIQINDISLPQWSLHYLSQTFRSFLFAQKGNQPSQSVDDSTMSGKQINVRQRMIPPPTNSDE